MKLARHALSGYVYGPERRVLELPRWLRPNSASAYWHIPRQAADRGGHLSVQTWCGQLRYPRRDEFTERAPLENRCGTCVGRAEGWEQRNGLIFRPRDPFALPLYCPAISHRDQGRRCGTCGAKRSWGHHGGGEQRHKAGPGLAGLVPCPAHGWVGVGFNGQALVCRVWTMKWPAGVSGACGHVLKRRGQ